MTSSELVIGITGPMGAGKDTTCGILNEILHDAVSVVTGGEIIRSITIGLGVPKPESRESLQQTYSVLSKIFGNLWLQQEIARRWAESGKRIWVLNGVRMPWDIEFIRRYPAHLILFLSCDMKLRFERLLARRDTSRKTDEAGMVWEEFIEMHKRETETFIDSIAFLPGVVVVDNTGSVDHLRKQIIHAFSNAGVTNTLQTP